MGTDAGYGTTVEEPGTEQAPARRRLPSLIASPRVLLAGVCVVHALLAIGFVVGHHIWWEQDETVYLSQVTPHAPALTFTAPRARGMPALLYPISQVTRDVTAIRTYLVVLGTVGLYVGLSPWIRLGFGRLVALAGLIYTTLWGVTFFGAEAQPNFTFAWMAVGVVGYFLLALREPDRRRSPVIMAALIAAGALVRPSDATWLAAPLVIGLLFLRTTSWRRRARVGATLVIGLCVGWSEWVVEAYASYGGFLHRLHEANALNTPGIHFALLTQARAIDGPTLCRPCSQVALSPAQFAWWFAVPPLIAIALFAARGTPRFAPLAFATVAGTALLLEYTLTVNYAAPRFLLPTYLLLAIPTASGLATLGSRAARSAYAPALVTGLVVVLILQVATQTTILSREVNRIKARRSTYLTAAAALRKAGVTAPCLVSGLAGPPVGYLLGCDDHPQPPDAFRRVKSGTSVLIFTGTQAGRGAFPELRTVSLGGVGRLQDWVAHVLPADGPAP
ncbi:MAG TPA: hypothetical protein VMH41_11965 [Mycobacteriales bacterium]|nr:hypothetical protein [Mycobacteriales bacterium]